MTNWLFDDEARSAALRLVSAVGGTEVTLAEEAARVLTEALALEPAERKPRVVSIFIVLALVARAAAIDATGCGDVEDYLARIDQTLTRAAHPPG